MGSFRAGPSAVRAGDADRERSRREPRCPRGRRRAREALATGDSGLADEASALLVPIARDFPDSDLVGIEITGEFMARCIERQRAMEFGGTYVHFHQRNITEPVFEPASIDTTICNSTTHELWSSELVCAATQMCVAYGDADEDVLAWWMKGLPTW